MDIKLLIDINKKVLKKLEIDIESRKERIKFYEELKNKGISSINYEENILTDRENEILIYIEGGFTNQEISETCFISINTVKKHVSRIYRKTGFDRFQLIRKGGYYD